MRDKKLTVAVVALVSIGLLAYLVVYSVRVDSVAAHYRFGKVLRVIRPTVGQSTDAEGALAESTLEEGVEVITRAGWFFKLPWPFDSVAKYDQRMRIVDNRPTQTQLPDGNQVIPRVYATWRLVDPIAFQQNLRGDIETAEARLENIINNSANSVLGKYRLEDLVNTDPEKLKFDQVEEDIYSSVKRELTNMENAYGIELTSLGITWIALPEETTTAVFARMRKERESVAKELEATGQRIKRTKIAEARQQRDRILAEAEAEAKDIRAQAEAEVATYYETFAKNEELAIFLRRLEALSNITTAARNRGEPITLVVSALTEPFRALYTGPETRGESEALLLPPLAPAGDNPTTAPEAE